MDISNWPKYNNKIPIFNTYFFFKALKILIWRKKRMRKIQSMANDKKKWWWKIVCTIHIYGVYNNLFFKLEMQTKYISFLFFLSTFNWWSNDITRIFSGKSSWRCSLVLFQKLFLWNWKSFETPKVCIIHPSLFPNIPQ